MHGFKNVRKLKNFLIAAIDRAPLNRLINYDLPLLIGCLEKFIINSYALYRNGKFSLYCVNCPSSNILGVT